MPSRLLRVLGDLRGSRSRLLGRRLIAQLDATLQGAALCERVANGEIGWEAARLEMADIEHAGDRERAALVHDLSMAIVTPMDREDVFRISRAIDDVLDNLRVFVREGRRFQAQQEGNLRPVATAIVKAVADLRGAVELVTSAPSEIARGALLARKGASEVRKACEVELARLLDHEPTSASLKQWELLRRLDAVASDLALAANVLSDAAIKRNE